jgi:4-hydroxyphenylpyruvate dioxygenase
MIAMEPKPKYLHAIASMSLGRAWAHELPAKLDQARKYGFRGVELFYEDLEYVARGIDEKVLPETLIQASYIVRGLCDDRGLEIIALQPFMHYEGLRDRAWHAQRVAEMKLWLKLAKILGTDLIQIPSSFLDESIITGDREVIVADLREIADLGMREDPTMRFAYESLAWGTYTDRWEECWEIVQQIDMPNFGIVLDTFNIAARIYADPTSATGMNPDADVATSESIKRMVNTIDPQKIFFVQLADAERLASPLVRGHELYDASQPARMSWSRNCRLFYGEEAQGGYLPIKEISKVILKDLGYQGWVSFELFHRCLTSSYMDVPEKMASRGAASWKRLVADLDLDA